MGRTAHSRKTIGQMHTGLSQLSTASMHAMADGGRAYGITATAITPIRSQCSGACRITLAKLSFRWGETFRREVEPGKVSVFHRKVCEATIFGDPIDAIYALGAVSMNAIAALKLGLWFGFRILLRFRHGHVTYRAARVSVCTLSSAIFMQSPLR